jgi:hypothetical protein
LRKQIAGALVASMLIGSAPGWAAEATATTKARVEQGAQRQQFRDSIDRAIERAVDGEPAQATPGVVPRELAASGPALTAHERQDLDARSAALKTDPVARGTGGIIMLVLGTALTLGATAWAINHSKQDSTTDPTMSMR